MSNFNFEYMGDYLQYKDAKGNTLIVNGGIINETATGQVAEITDGAENIPVKSLVVTINPIQEGSGDPSPENIRPISGRTTIKVWRESTYDTSAEPVLSIQLGGIIYGGTVNVTSGVMTVNMAMVTVTGDNLTSVGTASSGIRYATFPLEFAAKMNLNKISNMYIASISALLNNSIRTLNRVGYIYDNRFVNLETARRLINETNVQLVYELEQPITVQLTPEQLTTLLGTNYIWSDADSVSVDYVADTKLYIQKAISDSI